jgi:Tryptophan halogenase
MAEFFDVAIVGGGPAGSTAGTLLAKHGWNVAIFEKERFPRFKIGESLLPGSLRTFERMGVKEKIDQAEVIVKYGGKIIFGLWYSEQPVSLLRCLSLQISNFISSGALDVRSASAGSRHRKWLFRIPGYQCNRRGI